MADNGVLEIEGLTGTMRLEGQWLEIGSECYFLSQRERDVMWFFMRRPNWVYASEEVMNSVWGMGYSKENARVQIAHLRSMFEEDPSNPRILRTAGLGTWSSGYVLITDPRKEVALDRLFYRDGRKRK